MNRMVENLKNYKWQLLLLLFVVYSMLVYSLEVILCDLHFKHEHLIVLSLVLSPLILLFILLLASHKKKDKFLTKISIYKTKIEQLENNFSGLIFYINENNEIVNPNQHFITKLGLDPTNKLINQVFDNNTTNLILNLLNDAKENNFSKGECIYLDPNYFYLHPISIKDDSKSKLTMIIGNDITSEKVKENEIRKNEYKFRNIFEQSKLGIWIINLDGYIIDINSYLIEMLGYESKEDFGIKKFSDIVFFQDQQYCHELISDVKNKIKTQWKTEKRLVKKDGTIITCSFNGCLISEDEGHSWLLLSFIDDISEIKKIELEKANSQYLLNTIIDYIPEMIILKDAKTFNYLAFNKAFEKQLGAPKSSIVNASAQDFLREDASEIIEQNNKEVIKTKGILDISSVTLTNKMNISKTYHAKIIPILDTENQVKYILSIYRDLTEQFKFQAALANEQSKLENKVKERTYELETSLHNLEQLNIQKSKFISSLSHELRTPLNAIIGFSELLNNQFFGDLNDKQMNYVNLINNSAKHLLEMINDLLDISKIDAGVDTLNVSDFSIEEFLENIIESFGPISDPKNIKIRCSIDKNIEKIYADKRKCKQILLNILSNAVKFSNDNDEIAIKVSADDENIKFQVTDNGIGIDSVHIDKIFSDFYQVGDSYSSPKEGTGIGLSLCRRLVNIQGGQIGVSSQLDKGSTFWFTIPKLAMKKNNASLIPNLIQTKKNENNLKTILLVEDNQINLSLFLDILSIEDHQVIVARNGIEALARAKEHKPKLILLDIFMPEMDGLTVVQKLREEADFKDIPIIAVTASVGEEAKKMHLQAGFTDQIDKPVKVKEMLNTISKYM